MRRHVPVVHRRSRQVRPSRTGRAEHSHQQRRRRPAALHPRHEQRVGDQDLPDQHNLALLDGQGVPAVHDS
jgi:hypothetical protein